MQFFKGMAEGGKNGGEVFGNGFAAAGEGNDDGASERPGDGAEMAAVGVLARLACIIACSKPGRRALKDRGAAPRVWCRVGRALCRRW